MDCPSATVSKPLPASLPTGNQTTPPAAPEVNVPLVMSEAGFAVLFLSELILSGYFLKTKTKKIEKNCLVSVLLKLLPFPVLQIGVLLTRVETGILAF